ncbi:alpha/beta hydrolase [Tistrella bauzanensis]|uniref:Alpha/beta hydrolase n=1 Tax=Tistrella bauzanensis TaxID=657419 RepID=A0ABQ1IE35_9PROT|nr:alpha/beta fold hydrolase [Tistrella bauzanensis]GGB34053.1 alpha/beta hydrolase [Tistrella bauzanensis]
MRRTLPLTRRFDHRIGPVFWDRFGDDGPDLVLVHGTPFNAAVWAEVMPALAARARVHVYDLPGYGQSRVAAGTDISLHVQNRVFADWVAHLGLARPPVVVGHDFGGATVLRAHLLDGVEMHRLVLVDAVALRPWGSAFVAHVRDHAAAFAGLPAHLHRALVAAYVAEAAHRPILPAILADILDAWGDDHGARAFYDQIARMDPAATDAVAPLLGQVRAPAQVLWGLDDRWLPADQGRALADRIGCGFTGVASAGHLLQLDAPAVLVAAVLDQLRS